MTIRRLLLQCRVNIILLSLLLVSLPVVVAVVGDCQKTSSCKCIYEDGDIIDLSPLAGQGDAKFKDQPDEGGRELYSWNPCTDFTEHGCNKVAVCAIEPGLPAPTYVSLGNQDSAQFTVDSGNLYLKYSGEKKGVLSTAEVKLTCSNAGDTFTANGRSTEGDVYGFELQSSHACPQRKGSSENDLSGGSILLIGFSSVLFLFCAAGIPIQIYVRKQSGKHVVPLSTFWFSLPGLVKDGVVFFVGKVRKRQSGYEKI